MQRALVWFLYTTGLRNFEIRSLILTDVNIDGLYGSIVGKGGKLRTFTFSEIAKKYLAEYLEVRAKLFPGKKSAYLFCPGVYGKNSALSE